VQGGGEAAQQPLQSAFCVLFLCASDEAIAGVLRKSKGASGVQTLHLQLPTADGCFQVQEHRTCTM
jgi:hypothetical protein